MATAKPTVASNNAEIKAIQTALEAKTKALEELQAKLGEMSKKDEVLEKENAELKAAIAVAQKAAKDNKDNKDNNKGGGVCGKDFYTLVAVPAAGVSPPAELVFNGVKCPQREVDGFVQFDVPVKEARVLLSATSGMKFKLVAPRENITFKRMSGLKGETVKVVPHVLDRTTNGRPFWKPVEIVESK